MKVLIIANGDLGDVDFLKKNITSWDYVICCDGGIRHLKTLDIKPDIIVGDFDSSSIEIIDYYKNMGIKIKSYSTDKDYTDSHIAIDHAISMNATTVYMIGALGTRWDHSLANILLLVRLAKRRIHGKILNSNNIIYVGNNNLEIDGEIGDVVSLLPIGDDVHILSTKGLRYSIDNKFLPIDNPYGISNVLTAKKAVVSVKSGWVVVIKARD